MSADWVLKDGVIRQVENSNQSGQRKVLVHLPTGKVVSSYSTLDMILMSLGWERCFSGDSDLLQYNKPSSLNLISLPSDFSKISSDQMDDIVNEIPNIFQVRDLN